MRIKELLYDEGFTIAGAKKRLDAELSSGGPQTRGAEPEPEAAVADEAPVPEVEDEPEEAPVAALDTASAERIETMRQGLEDALDQARDLLSMLEAAPAKKRRSKKKRSAKK